MDEVDTVVVAATGSALVSSPEEAKALIRRTSTRKKMKVVYTEEVQDADEAEQDDAFDGPLTDLDDAPAEEKLPKKRKRRTKTQEPVVYDIPPVETKITNFKGMSFVAYSDIFASRRTRTAWICMSEHCVARHEARAGVLLSYMSHRHDQQT